MKDGKATLTDGETIAGSATNLYDCMRKAVSFDIPLADAILRQQEIRHRASVSTMK